VLLLDSLLCISSPRSRFAATHDLVELKWQRLLPTLTDGAVVRRTRGDLRVSQSELAKAAGISQPMLALIEANQRRITEPVMHGIWSALWRLHQAQKTPPAVELLIRLNEEMDAVNLTQVDRITV